MQMCTSRACDRRPMLPVKIQQIQSFVFVPINDFALETGRMANRISLWIRFGDWPHKKIKSDPKQRYTLGFCAMIENARTDSCGNRSCNWIAASDPVGSVAVC